MENFKNLRLITVESKSNEGLKAERAIVHFITTPDIDKSRDVVDPKGMDTSEFGGTVFYNHNYNLPIAKNISLKAIAEGVKAKTVFAKSNAFAEDIYNLHLENVINTWSIGFLPKPGKGAVEYDDKKNIFYINEWRLFEYSSAPLAMNGEARDQMKSIIKSAEALKEIGEAEIKETITNEFVNSEEYKKMLALIEEIKTASQTEIEKLNTELTDLKNQFASKNVKVKSKLDVTAYTNTLLKRHYEQNTGRKLK